MLPLSSITSLPVKEFVRSPQASSRLRTVMQISPARWGHLRSRMCARKSHSERKRGRTTLSSGRGSSSTLRRFSARSPPLAAASPIEMSPGMRARPPQAEGLRACSVDLKGQLGWLIKSGHVEGSSPQAGSSGGGGEGASLAAVLAAARQSEKMEVRRGSPSKDEMRDVAAEKKTSVSVRLVRKCFLVCFASMCC